MEDLVWLILLMHVRRSRVVPGESVSCQPSVLVSFNRVSRATQNATKVDHYLDVYVLVFGPLQSHLSGPRVTTNCHRGSHRQYPRPQAVRVCRATRCYDLWMLINLLEGVAVMVVEMNMFGFCWHRFLVSPGFLHGNSLRPYELLKLHCLNYPSILTNRCVSRRPTIAV